MAHANGPWALSARSSRPFLPPQELAVRERVKAHPPAILTARTPYGSAGGDDGMLGTNSGVPVEGTNDLEPDEDRATLGSRESLQSSP